MTDHDDAARIRSLARAQVPTAWILADARDQARRRAELMGIPVDLSSLQTEEQLSPELLADILDSSDAAKAEVMLILYAGATGQQVMTPSGEWRDVTPMMASLAAQWIRDVVGIGSEVDEAREVIRLMKRLREMSPEEREEWTRENIPDGRLRAVS